MDKRRSVLVVFNSILLVLILGCLVFICYELVQLNDFLQNFEHNFDSFTSGLLNQ